MTAPVTACRANSSSEDGAIPKISSPADAVMSRPSQGTYLEESQLITVFDREENRLYLFELKHARARIQPARIDM